LRRTCRFAECPSCLSVWDPPLNGRIGDFRASDRQKPRDAGGSRHMGVGRAFAESKSRKCLSVRDLSAVVEVRLLSLAAIGTLVAKRGRPVRPERRQASVHESLGGVVTKMASYGLYMAAEGAHAQAKRLEVIANNMANVDTVGFKRQLAIFQARYAEAEQQGLSQPGSGSLDDVGGGIELLSTDTDFAPGPLQKTGIPTDIAIHGEGFFLVRRGSESLLTRAGNFRINNQGELVTQHGDAVLNDNGSPVVIAQPQQPFNITAEGEIQQGGATQRLAMVKTESPAELIRVGENTFRTESTPVPLQAKERQVSSGFLEGSGSTATTEMIEMLEATRILNANMNLMQAQDSMFGSLVGRLMRVN
jgi:flagellar basal-body rod protein FlgF